MIDALGWALAHFIWQGAFLGLVAWAVLRALPERRPEMRYAVTCGLLAAMALCPLVTLAVLWPVRGSSGAVPAMFGAPLSIPFVAVSTAPGATLWTWWAVALWTAGLAVMSIRATGGWVWAWRRQNIGRLPLPDSCRETVRRLAARMGLRLAVRWFVSAHVESPQLFGWFKPVVLVPLSAITSMPPQQLEALLAHELAHIRRHDFLVSACQVLVETVLFYHPAVWWLSARVREEREACCDRVAAEVCGDTLLYGRALLELEESRERYALAASGFGLARRFRRLLDPRDGIRPAWILVGAGVSALLLAIGSAGWLLAQAPIPSPSEDQSRAFLRDLGAVILGAQHGDIPASKRRDALEQVLQRYRPVLPQPEQQKVYHRRLAYSRERFGSLSSDRSRAYIDFGPPDEREERPQAYEIWRWRDGRTFRFEGPDFHLVGEWPRP